MTFSEKMYRTSTIQRNSFNLKYTIYCESIVFEKKNNYKYIFNFFAPFDSL